MAPSTIDSRKTPLHINAFGEKPTIAPTFSWDKGTQQWNFALLVKEEFQLETLLNGPPTAVTYPPGPTYGESVENYSQATELQRRIYLKSTAKGDVAKEM